MPTLIKILNKYKDMLLLGLVAAVIGVIVGAIDTVFGKVLLEITAIRNQYVFQLIPFLPLAGILIIYTYTNFGKNSQKGISLLFSVRFKEEESIPKRLVPLVIVSTWLTHLFGGSAGREGVAVQIGGTVAHNVGKKLSIKDSSKTLLITGMAAGFAGLFQTPIAATFFAMEVLIAGSLEYCALFPCIIAAFVANSTSHALGLEKFHVNLMLSLEPDFYLILKVAFLGIIYGMVGGLFAHLLGYTKKNLSKLISNPLLRIFITGCVLSVLLMLLHGGRYAGLGTNLIEAALYNGNIYGYDWLLKLLFTILTLSAGFQGGEVTPLFSIGASLGAIFSPVLGLPVGFASALGYAAVFGAATNTFLAPVMIGGEVFGYEYLPYFFLASAMAYVFNGNRSIYSSQKRIDALHPYWSD